MNRYEIQRFKFLIRFSRYNIGHRHEFCTKHTSWRMPIRTIALNALRCFLSFITFVCYAYCLFLFLTVTYTFDKQNVRLMRRNRIVLFSIICVIRK